MAISSIEIKIMSFDEQSNSLIVAFREAGSDDPFENQPSYAYQPYVFSASNVAELSKEIARTGVSVVEQSTQSKQFKQNTSFVDEIKNSVGTTMTYSVADLFAQPPSPQGQP